LLIVNRRLWPRYCRAARAFNTNNPRNKYSVRKIGKSGAGVRVIGLRSVFNGRAERVLTRPSLFPVTRQHGVRNTRTPGPDRARDIIYESNVRAEVVTRWRHDRERLRRAARLFYKTAVGKKPDRSCLVVKTSGSDQSRVARDSFKKNHTLGRNTNTSRIVTRTRRFGFIFRSVHHASRLS